jgi:hypothetical protein
MRDTTLGRHHVQQNSLTVKDPAIDLIDITAVDEAYRALRGADVRESTIGTYLRSVGVEHARRRKAEEQSERMLNGREVFERR